MNDVDTVKDKVDIVELVSEYVALKKAGRNFRANCPFHNEKTPSFMVSPSLGIFKCFGCGVGGDVFQFLMQIEGMEFGETLTALAKRVGVKLTEFKAGSGDIKDRLVAACTQASEYYHFLLVEHGIGKRGLAYLKDRGVDGEVVKIFKLGWAPDGWENLTKYLVNKKKFTMDELVRAGLAGVGGRGAFDWFRRRIVFPLRNHRGETVGFSGRLLPGDPEEGKTGKYINTPETLIYHKGELLYGLDLTRQDIKMAGAVVVVEGELDMISSFLAGVKNVAAIKGSALTASQVKLIKRFATEVVMALDSDVAGDAAVRRGIEMADEEGLAIKVVKMGEYKDPDDFARKDPEGWKAAVINAVFIYDFYIESAVTRHGMATADGKRRVGMELLPIWAKISDEIVKAHYVGKLAGALGVSEEAVWGQMGKISVTGEGEKGKEVSQMVTEVRTRSDVLEEYLMALAFADDPRVLLSGGYKGLIENRWGRRIIEELEKGGSGKKGKFDAKDFVSKIPAELRDGAGKLWLYDLPEDKEWLAKELNKTMIEIGRIRIRERLSGMSREISEKEKKGEETQKLEEEFSKLSKGLTGVV